MVLEEVEREELLHHSIHLSVGRLVVLEEVLRVPRHQIVHNHHLLLDHIGLVEYCLEEVYCILVSSGLDRIELEHL